MRNQVKFYFFSFAIFVMGCTAIMEILFPSSYTKASKNREPSSIQRVFDYSELTGNALQMAAKDRMINSIEIKKSGAELSIDMGNFVLMNENKERVFACGYFDKISFDFEGEGVIVEGEKPALTVETSCDIAANINFLSPIKLPLSALLAQKPSNTEYKFFEGGRTLTMNVNHSPTNWPKRWILKGVKMTNSKITARNLNIPTFEVGMGHRNMITMSW